VIRTDFRKRTTGPGDQACTLVAVPVLLPRGQQCRYDGPLAAGRAWVPGPDRAAVGVRRRGPRRKGVGRGSRFTGGAGGQRPGSTVGGGQHPRRSVAPAIGPIPPPGSIARMALAHPPGGGRLTLCPCCALWITRSCTGLMRSVSLNASHGDGRLAGEPRDRPGWPASLVTGSAGSAAAGAPRPLVVCAHPELLDALLRLCAAAGTTPRVVPEPGAALPLWSKAPLVVVGTDLAEQTAALSASGQLARREGVLLVGADREDGGAWRCGVQLAAEQVLFLPDAEPRLLDRLATLLDGPGRGGQVAVVIGGRGGAGATVLALALGLAGLRAGLRTMLVDADPLGGGMDLALGVEGAPGLRWGELSGLHGRLPSGALAGALPAVGEMTVLSCGREGVGEGGIPAPAMQSLLEAGCRGSDLVIVDLPRWPSAAGHIALSRARTALLVVPAEVRACASAARVVEELGAHSLDLQVVVRGPGPSRLAPASIASSLGLPLAAAFRSEPALALALERGEPPGRSRGPLARAANRLVSAIANPVAGVAA